MRTAVAFVLFLILLPAPAPSKEILVPGDYPTIQQAIDAAMDLDTIKVDPGTYVENIDYKGKAVTVLSTAGPGVTAIDGSQSGVVVKMIHALGVAAVLEGFTVTNGKGSPGGGINCIGASTISGNIVCGNIGPYGGGIYCKGDTEVRDNVISGNVSTGIAGGIFCYAGAARIEKNLIKENTASEWGGGIHCLEAQPVLSENIITQNAGRHGGGLSSYFSTTRVENNTILENSAVYYGGGIYSYNDTLTCIEGNVLAANEGAWGGGIGLNYSSPWITANTILANQAVAGGGLYCWNATPELANNLLAKNTASAGGGIDLQFSSPAVFNCTITENTAQGSGVGGGFRCIGSSPSITNSILWGNMASSGPEIHFDGYSHPLVVFCDVQGGWPGGGNIEYDPLFEDPSSDDFHLDWRSPCINRGANEGAPPEDIDGDPRPWMGTADMGADEFIGDHALGADVFSLSGASGGQVQFALFGGAPNGGRAYLLLGSATGSVPGTPLPGGQAILPLNFDLFTAAVIQLLNTPVFHQFMGMLSPGSSTAQAVLDTLGPIPGAAGLELTFAFALAHPWDFASNPVFIEVVP